MWPGWNFPRDCAKPGLSSVQTSCSITILVWDDSFGSIPGSRGRAGEKLFSTETGFIDRLGAGVTRCFGEKSPMRLSAPT